MAFMKREVTCEECGGKFETIEVYNLKAEQPVPRMVHGTVQHGGEKHIKCTLTDKDGKVWTYADMFHAIGDHIALFEFPEAVKA